MALLLLINKNKEAVLILLMKCRIHFPASQQRHIMCSSTPARCMFKNITSSLSGHTAVYCFTRAVTAADSTLVVKHVYTLRARVDRWANCNFFLDGCINVLVVYIAGGYKTPTKKTL